MRKLEFTRREAERVVWLLEQAGTPEDRDLAAHVREVTLGQPRTDLTATEVQGREAPRCRWEEEAKEWREACQASYYFGCPSPDYSHWLRTGEVWPGQKADRLRQQVGVQVVGAGWSS